MPNTVTHKLELFEEAILAKAAAERQEAEQVTERMKKAELDKEENRLLNGLYQQIQDQIHQMQTENVKEISRNARDLKKQLYQQREQYLAEIIARARAELAVFSKGPDYPAYLERQTQKLAADCPDDLPDAELLLRPEDLPLAGQVKSAFGRECTVDGSEQIQLGGVLLRSRARGIEVDLTLVSALAEQKDWFFSHSNFHLE